MAKRSLASGGSGLGNEGQEGIVRSTTSSIPFTSAVRRRKKVPSNEMGTIVDKDEQLIQGWLYKQGKHTLGHRWSKRYFVLQKKSQILQYYKTLPVNGQAKEFEIGPYCRVEDTGRVTSSSKELYTFQLQKGNTHRLVVGSISPEVAAQWMDSIRKKIDSAIQSPGSSQHGESLEGAVQRLGSIGNEDEDNDLNLSSRETFTFQSDSALSALSYAGTDSSVDRDGDSDLLMDVDIDVLTEEEPNEIHGDSLGPLRSSVCPPLHKEKSLGQGPPRELGEMFEHMQSIRPSATQGVFGEGSWKLIRLENGLRFFEEGGEGRGALAGGMPSMSAVGTVEASCDKVFKLILDLGDSRAQWDLAYAGAKVVEVVDGHTDFIYYQSQPLPLPLPLPLPFGSVFRLPPRDLVLRRYWQRESDGSYLILYQSMDHEQWGTNRGFVRASLTYGSFVLSPAGPDRSLVMNVLALDPGGWVPRCGSFVASLHYFLLSRVAGIREFFAQTKGTTLTTVLGLKSSPSSSSSNNNLSLSNSPKDISRTLSKFPIHSRLSGKFPTAKPIDFGETSGKNCEGGGGGGEGGEGGEGGGGRGGGGDLSWASSCGSLKLGPSMGGVNCWSEAEARLFPVRSKTYLSDKAKIEASPSAFRLVACDWLKSKTRIDHVVARRKTCVEVAREKFLSTEENKSLGASNPFFFVVNMQVPAAQQFSMVFFWASKEPPSPSSLLGRFINGDDLFRNTRLKLIPRIQQGAWVVKRSVGTTPLIVAGALKVDYYRGPLYFECDVDIGSSAVANGIVRFVLGYVKTLVIDMAFLIQSNTDEELPETLLGTCRLSQLDPAEALDLDDSPDS